MFSKIENIIEQFGTISLKEVGKEQLMNRIDNKYVFHIDMLPDILEQIKNDYKIVLVQTQKIRQYATKYFDTDDFRMYLQHHNGQLPRYKSRYRTYIESGETFFEVKAKNNKSRTIKKRIKSELPDDLICENDISFLEKHTKFKREELKPSLNVSFYRLTLQNSQHKERVTIDLNLKAFNQLHKKSFENLVIVETKQEQHIKSAMKQALKNQSILSNSFSKYCFSMTKLYPNLKQNNFKMKYKHINKLLYETN